VSYKKKLIAGCYPGSLDKQEADRKLRGLLNHGIRHVINLMEPDEFNWDMKPFKPYERPMAAIADSSLQPSAGSFNLLALY
jgi:hypothetical protein